MGVAVAVGAAQFEVEVGRSVVGPVLWMWWVWHIQDGAQPTCCRAPSIGWRWGCARPADVEDLAGAVEDDAGEVAVAQDPLQGRLRHLADVADLAAGLRGDERVGTEALEVDDDTDVGAYRPARSDLAAIERPPAEVGERDLVADRIEMQPAAGPGVGVAGGAAVTVDRVAQRAHHPVQVMGVDLCGGVGQRRVELDERVGPFGRGARPADRLGVRPRQVPAAERGAHYRQVMQPAGQRPPQRAPRPR